MMSRFRIFSILFLAIILSCGIAMAEDEMPDESEPSIAPALERSMKRIRAQISRC